MKRLPVYIIIFFAGLSVLSGCAPALNHEVSPETRELYAGIENFVDQPERLLNLSFEEFSSLLGDLSKDYFALSEKEQAFFFETSEKDHTMLKFTICMNVYTLGKATTIPYELLVQAFLVETQEKFATELHTFIDAVYPAIDAITADYVAGDYKKLDVDLDSILP